MVSMDTFQVVIVILAAVILFLHGLESFSNEIREAGEFTFEDVEDQIRERLPVPGPEVDAPRRGQHVLRCPIHA